MLNKELINKCRVLTMSNNRKCDYLVINLGRNGTVLMGIKESNNTTDVIFIKKIYSKDIKYIHMCAINLCHEFDIGSILTDRVGVGLPLYEYLLNNTENILITGIRYADDSTIIKLSNDIDKCNIRFMQTYECALKSYRKSFLGFSEIMNSHKETDELINEIDNIELITDINKRVKLNAKDKNVENLRFNCLLVYYAYKYNEENGKKLEKEIQRRMANYEILHGIFYKYIYKAIDNEKLQIAFYHNDCKKLEKFKNIINEKEFKEIRNNEIERVIFGKTNLEIYFKNGSYIKFLYVSDCARGQRYHYAIVDTDIPRETYSNVIRPKLVSYYKDKNSSLKIQELKDTYRIEFMNFRC